MVNAKPQKPTVRLLILLRSNKLFWAIFGIFLLTAIWIALSGAYSMAFDEYVHYGIMQLYVHQWSPFLAHQPAGADALGAVARDPSYLYHYLMSFPLRVFAHFFHAFAAQIIFLRMFDIGFFAAGLLLFRAAFKRAGLSKLVSNISLGLFMLLPVTPFLAAQVNYDNLLFLLTGLSLWLAIGVASTIAQDRIIPVLPAIWLLVIAMLASLVKYAYLPILVALCIYFVVLVVRRIGWRAAKLGAALRVGLTATKRWQLVAAVLAVLLAGGLFTERYGINLVRYHTPIPECNQVISLQHCLAYEPFARNYVFHQGDYDLPAGKIASYPYNDWARYMIRSLLFVVGSKQSGYQAGEPLTLTYGLGDIVLIGGSLAVIWRLRWLWRQNVANQLFISITGMYVVVLFLQNFMDFLHTHVPVAIQGRYLIPVLSLLFVLITQVMIKYFRHYNPRFAAVVFAILCFMLLEGGSLIPFVVRAHDNWLWNAPVVRDVNHAARDVLDPVMIGS